MSRSRRHPNSHGHFSSSGHSGARGIAHYGVVKGKPQQQGVFRPASASNQPHLHILVDGGKMFDVTVDVFSQEKSEVRYLIVPNFSPSQAAKLTALAPGSTDIKAGQPDGIGLDYIRQHLFDPSDLSLLPIDPVNLDNDLHNGLASLIDQAIQANADLYAFGSLFNDSAGGHGPNPFNIDPVLGIHNIHMNQGNPPGNHDQDNGTYQDGGLLVYFGAGSRQYWVAVFLAFQSQVFTSDDAGNPDMRPSLARTRTIPGRHQPAILTRPAEFRTAIAPERHAHIVANLQKIPAPRKNPPIFGLADVIGNPAVNSIKASGQIVIHAVGDTGHGDHTAQTDVADAMAQDFDKPNPADHPAFFLHLGDVIYGSHKDQLYRDMFYSPYDHYPGQIVAIPGNHDGEVFPDSDPVSLKAFQANFCDSEPRHPAIAGTLPRTTMTQPGVYFLLEAPYVRIIGLYSNVAENPGFISGPQIGDAQKQFLVDQLTRIAKLRAGGDTDALVLAVHHPPYSGGGHSGSLEMLDDIDEAVLKAGVAPDLVLSAHAHNYQRFTRKFILDGVTLQIPYHVCGGGGHGITPIKLAADSLAVEGTLPGKSGDHSLRQYYNGYGYASITVTPRVLTVDFFAVPATDDVPLDTVTVDLRSHKIIDERAPFVHPATSESTGGNRARVD